MRPNPPPPHTVSHIDVAASLREALLAAGWTLRHDNVGEFLVRKGDTNLKVTVYSVDVVATLTERTARGGFKWAASWRQERNLDGSLPVAPAVLVDWTTTRHSYSGVRVAY